QIESRLRSLVDLAANTDGAARLLRETESLREAKTGSLVGTLGGEERLENPRQNFRRDAKPRVTDRNRYELAFDCLDGLGAVEGDIFSRQGNDATLGHGVACVHHQIDERQFEFGDVDRNRPDVRRKLD